MMKTFQTVNFTEEDVDLYVEALDNLLGSYNSSLFCQDMETTNRVGHTVDLIKSTLKRMKELKGKFKESD